MNRKLKNIVMIVFVILLLGTSIYTIYHIKNNSNSTHEMLLDMPNKKWMEILIWKNHQKKKK